MPKNKNIKKILVIGSGPVVIGQGAEFDYSGTQACLALKELGYEIILVNSNPATIMTDRNIAHKIYLEPLDLEHLRKIILKEKPDALLGTFGGQTGLNLTVELFYDGVLKKINCEIIGTSVDAIEQAENREKFIELCRKTGQKCVDSIITTSVEGIMNAAKEMGYPVVLRPAYTLGGTGGGFAENKEELIRLGINAIQSSPIRQVLVEKSIKGFKEIEYEIIRDANGTVINICNMENLDPVGVHTGDSIVICPSQTLSNREYQTLRTAAVNIVDELKIVGGCNVQFAVDPDSFDYFVIEINPRISRSSALASKASGYPIARVCALLACGLGLEEVKISSTIAAFEPSLDYVVTKIPRFPFDKFDKACRKLNTQMKSTGEVMAIGRNFEESFLKAIRSLELSTSYIRLQKFEDSTLGELYEKIRNSTDEQIFIIAQILRMNGDISKINEITKIDTFFLNKIKNIVDFEKKISRNINPDILKEAKKLGFPDEYIAFLCNKTQREIYDIRMKNNIKPVYKMIDTCSSEFDSYVPYFYSTYNGQENESRISSNKNKIVVLGSGPIRIGQGIEFDYSTVHAVLTLRKFDYEVIVINNNPSTVSTDYTFSNKLYFEPLQLEDILNVLDIEKPEGVIVSLGGQTPINLAELLQNFGVKVIGTQVESIKIAEDRNEFEEFLNRLSIPRPKGKIIYSKDQGYAAAEEIGYPVLIRPSFVLGGRAMKIVHSKLELSIYLKEAETISKGKPILIDKYISGKEFEVDAVSDGEEVFVPTVMEHFEKTGIHSGDSIISYSSFSISKSTEEKIIKYTKELGLNLKIIGMFNIQYIVDENENVYVIEVNPRSSRTVPFISKACCLNLVEIATKVQIGFSLKNLNINNKVVRKYFVKVPVFSSSKILEADIYLSPEMKSTGEAIGSGDTLNEAFFNGLKASGFNTLFPGIILVSVSDEHKSQAVPIVRRFIDLNFNIEATKGTYNFLIENGIDKERVILRKKISDGDDEILKLIGEKYYSYIINTLSFSESNNRDGFLIRRKTIESGVSIFTSLDTVNMFLNAIEEIKIRKCHMVQNEN
ncbi:MAG: carbamoyl-phosphate synthase large subunit [Candidatus Improbicoccus pseudotrichonymphae]|uniref:Carbamoyl-phosphate synthase large subunit n=1 Tax=Candidatus Improbicoccus pseudotrichonymphae TaxID=3033792 RepID=A0AA48HV82_9FIRM|nr:MAG: carbamoyl-phosphate synthase large subunit [Candidatus Improbicoccus pseudotrichonymphae]